MKKKIHYAWVIMASCFAILMCLSGMVLAATGTFLKPVSESLGISRTAFTSYTLLSGVFGMFASLNAGKILQKLGVRKTLTAGAALVSLAMLGYSRSSAMWHFWVFGAVSGFGAGFASTVVCSVLLNNWFCEKKGLATSIAFMGTSTGTLVFSRLGLFLLARVGWRWSYAAFAAILLAVVISTALLLVVETPEQKGLRPYGAGGGPRSAGAERITGITRGAFLRTPTFYTLAASCFLAGMVIMGVQNHLLAFLDDLGYATSMVSNLYTVYLIVQIMGKVVLGAALDRFGVKASLLYICVTHLLSMAGLLSAARLPMAFAGVAGLGLAAGICTLLPPYLTAALVGNRDYANIFGAVNIFLSLGVSISTMVTSMIFDATGGYGWAWIIYGAGMILLAVCVFSSLRTGRRFAGTAEQARDDAYTNSFKTETAMEKEDEA